MGKRREWHCRRTGEDAARINRRREVKREAWSHGCHCWVHLAWIDWLMVVVDGLCRKERGLRLLLKELQEKSTAVLRKGGGASAMIGGERIRRSSAAFRHGRLALVLEWEEREMR